MGNDFHIRRATRADLDVMSEHRARMFFDMGELSAEIFETFRAQSKETLRGLVERDQYIGWLASPHDEPDKIVAGAGVTLREIAPHPQPNSNGKFEIVSGRQAIIQNVYTEPEWRRRGLAALLIQRVIDWTREQEIESVVLHASDEGRAVYERLGFVATTEMRLTRSDRKCG
ncbi:MAG TPA: GNAT family N-acetyltransferase [Chthoniobacterales bacterium]|nr:GNAT family N-acetyltransferase [Chthoniobacterales bacterium]